MPAEIICVPIVRSRFHCLRVVILQIYQVERQIKSSTAMGGATQIQASHNVTFTSRFRRKATQKHKGSHKSPSIRNCFGVRNKGCILVFDLDGPHNH